MEETVNTKSIVIERQDYRENDILVSLYSPEKGRMSLVARGAKKQASKLSGHIEPLNLVDLMVVKGKKFDYVGSIRNIQNFSKIKSSYDKTTLSQKALRLYKRLLKEGEGDQEIFLLLYNFLVFLESNTIEDEDLFFSIFKLKLFSNLGFSLSLNRCSKCAKSIAGKLYIVSISQGGVVCNNCARENDSLTISENCLKMLKLATKSQDSDINKININNKDKKDFLSVVSSFENYHLN